MDHFDHCNWYRHVKTCLFSGSFDDYWGALYSITLRNDQLILNECTEQKVPTSVRIFICKKIKIEIREELVHKKMNISLSLEHNRCNNILGTNIIGELC